MTEDRWAGLPALQAQSEILTEMSRDLLEAISGDWDHATFRAIKFGGQGSARLEIVGAAGGKRFGKFRTASSLASDLRRVMFVEGRGSWFSMTLTLRNGGSADADFDYETKPEFDSRVLGVNGYRVAQEQVDFPRDREHQPDWYAQLLEEYLDELDAKDRVREARDRGWAAVGQSGAESDGARLVVLSSGVGVLASYGYSDPSPNHPGDPGFELYLPSTLFAGDVERARGAWPSKALGYLIGMTTDEDVDWPARVADGPVAVTYVPNLANSTPADWRGEHGKEDLCGMLVGVPFPGVPQVLDGPDGPIRLVGVLPARPAEWAYLRSGGQEARADVAERLAQVDPSVLASPGRPSVV